MNLKEAVNDVLGQLRYVIDQIEPGDYTSKISTLKASFGEHARHIIEFYICLIKGLDNGIINYDNRERDIRIESDTIFANNKIQELLTFINNYNENPALVLNISYSYSEIDNLNIQSNYLRELAYNIEHTIHHLAIIKTAIVEYYGYIELPGNFGIASSTVRYSNIEK